MSREAKKEKKKQKPIEKPSIKKETNHQEKKKTGSSLVDFLTTK